MKFTRLRVLGFKSFVEPGEFVIERGLTGVVGPNGCGKSNLVEALRWVMGESSYKNMRASGMDDVIFSGSSVRPARNTAEVTLFLDNSDRTAPAAFNDADELQVSRRIEREAGSVYRINGREARAKDVQLLFADQSTGARSPSMVGQGRIGELIQAKPQARRALLEEAAGISGLHSRRHEAELRLRAAEQNLERLDDVVGELEVQIENLKRQSRQAARFKNLSGEIREAEALQLHLRWHAARLQEGEAQSALAAATSKVAEAASAQMNAAKDQAVGAQGLPALREAEAAAAAALQRLSIARGQLEEEASRIRARHAELSRRIEQLDADSERERRISSDNAAVLARLAGEEAGLAAEDAGAEARESAAETVQQQALGALSLSEGALSLLTAEKAEAVAARGQMERAVKDAAARHDRLSAQLAAADREAGEIAQRLAALPDPAEKKRLAAEAELRLTALETAVSDAEKALRETRLAEDAARPPVADARAALASLEAEAKALARLAEAGGKGRYAPVLDAIRVERGWETALGAALGDDLDAPLDAAAPIHWAGADARDDPALPAGIRSLAAVADAPLALGRRLAQVGLVEAADGPRLQRELRPGQRLVSRDGALWRWDGLTARADAPSAAAQRLAQRNRLTELDAERAGAGAAALQAEQALSVAQTQSRAASSAETAARQEAKNAQRGLQEARDALLRAERGVAELAARQTALQEGRRRPAAEVSEALTARQVADTALAAAPALVDLSGRLDAQSAVVAREREAAAQARARLDGVKREGETRRRRLAAIAAERSDWLRRAENAEAQLTALDGRRAETQAELAALADAPDEIDARRRALLSELSGAEAKRKAEADRLQAAENRQRALDAEAQGAIQSRAAARETRARAEEKLHAAEERRVETEARIRDKLQVAPHLALAQAGSKPGADLPALDDIERRVDRLRIERERLGAVNLRAEEEHRELADRLETIVSERTDIVDAIGKLRQAIQSLNREGRERLMAAFDTVNAQFQRLFSRLFGGGTAVLQLIESDDPLEAGLEIIARPPGKKPQTMTLLSGGEQALTAMALIFAVFLTNPAPVCVLDEVDAPLDDHNVERFCNLMDEMAASTQTRFIIITHNPITMARMNRLFGVTMAEQGVSQLVSVDLGTAEALREAG